MHGLHIGRRNGYFIPFFLPHLYFKLNPDVFETVNRSIETFGDPCKRLLECFYYENLSWVKIASSLGYSNAASARNQKYKCLERIRKTVGMEVK